MHVLIYDKTGGKIIYIYFSYNLLFSALLLLGASGKSFLVINANASKYELHYTFPIFPNILLKVPFVILNVFQNLDSFPPKLNQLYCIKICQRRIDFL